ncbi:hypothetical protein, partial [Allopontixanthobacter sp.]|uniref:hypothetical protein n=1 Tax=Allopontixanthobacter sp. TaxID=2906452 RepID=UPI002AB91BA8
FEDLQKALGGDKEALAGFLDPAKPKKAKAARKGKKEKTPEEIAADFADETAQLEAETLRARQRLATNAEDRAAIGFELLDIELKQKIAAIEASDFSDEQKAALKKQVATLLGHQTVLDEQGNILVSGTDSLEAQLIARERSAELERDAQGLAQEHYDAVRDVLQLQFDLADTEAERKRLALAMLDAEEAYLRSRLEAVVNSQVANDAEKLRAQVALDAMAATAAQRRESVARANETSVERFMRDLNKTPEQLNEAVDQIKIGGLEAFNSELVNAIVNFRSLGDVARSVVRQMLSEFLQLQIQQNLIRPLAGRLGLGQAAGAGQSSAGELQAAGATMTAAGGTLTTAAGVWSATAAQIQAAAASMAASAAGGGGLGGGGGGGLGGLLGAVGSLLGGASPQASLVGSVEGLFADPSFAGLFAGGGLIPSGQFGIVGEAGPEPVFATDGGVQVLPNSAMRRGSFSAKSGGDTIVIPQTFLVPERSDPRRTKSSVDRGTQQALGVASRKNLA